jgi:hypothetical protein
MTRSFLAAPIVHNSNQGRWFQRSVRTPRLKTASGRQFVHPRLGAHSLGEFGQVLMVGELDDLPDASHPGEQAQRFLGVNSADSNDVRSIS